MGKIKFIHCADIHFDTSFSGLPANKAAIRRDELRSNFLEIINHCIEKNADVLLIAGDLFDNTRVTDETIGFLIDCFLRIPEVKVFITPGNHDPYMPGSMYDDSKWPDNVHIFSEKSITKVSIEHLKLNVYGAAFTAPYIDKSLLENFTADAIDNDPSQMNILLIHGDVVSPGQQSAYNPIFPGIIAQSGFDYIALGHKHNLLCPEKAGNSYFAYSGTPEGKGFDETDEKGIIYGELYHNSLKETNLEWEFIPCSKRIYRDITIDLTGCYSHEEVSDLINQSLSGPEDLYKFILTGSLKNSFLLDLNILYSKFSDKCFFIKFRDLTNTEVDLDSLSGETMLKGIFARRMIAKINDARKKNNSKDEQLYTDALVLGLKAFDGEVPVYDNQIS